MASLTYENGEDVRVKPLHNMTFWVGAGFSKAWDARYPDSGQLFRIDERATGRLADPGALARTFGKTCPEASPSGTRRVLAWIVHRRRMAERRALTALLKVAPLLSPTWRLAVWRKSRYGKAGRTRFIKAANCRYLATGAVLAGATFCATCDVAGRVDWSAWGPSLAVLAWYLISRCNEIVYAFYRDAFDKLDPRGSPSSALTWPTCVWLAVNSDAELVLNFAVLYALLPDWMWQTGAQRPRTFSNLLSYSALTITTSGGGGFVTKHWLAQFLTSYEFVCSQFLVVVSFTI